MPMSTPTFTSIPTMPRGSTELFDASRGPRDDMPLTNALFWIIADMGLLVWDIKIVTAGLRCWAICVVSDLDGTNRRKVPLSWEELHASIESYALKHGCRVRPLIVVSPVMTTVLPVEPFLARSRDKSAV